MYDDRAAARIGRLAALVPALLLANVGSARSADPPPPPREFRAAWVATVANIDWPSRPGLSTADQQAEARAILDRCAELNLNAVVLQVRTAADALYDSKLEPWSAVLSGEQGKAPEPYYDPLVFWTEEAHRRGLQLHAWINPFRAKPAGSKYELSATHVGRTHPEWVKEYGGYLWMDPGAAEAREHTLAVASDIVSRYDVDGLHIDDYFYPYPVNDPATGKPAPFPDDPSWEAARATRGKLERDDWRRQNISRLVEDLNRAVHEAKSAAQFGVSPFGIPRPGRPEGVVGFDQYAALYADTEQWLDRGWCDYWTPQLYWKIEAPGQPFRPLLKHWIAGNTQKRHVWPGLSVSRVGTTEKAYRPAEILGQLAIIREFLPQDPGHVLFSMKALMNDRAGLPQALKEGPYAGSALVPPTPWLDAEAPAAPRASLDGASVRLEPAAGEVAFNWAVWTRAGTDEAWTFAVHPATVRQIPLPAGARSAAIAAVDRLGNLSPVVTMAVPKP